MNEQRKVTCVADVRAWVNEVDAMPAEGPDSDPEESHWEVDQLMAATLAAIAAGFGPSDELAREALRAWELPLTRWYA